RDWRYRRATKRRKGTTKVRHHERNSMGGGICRDCKQSKEKHELATGKTGVICRECHRKRNNKYRASNLEKARESYRKWYANHGQKHLDATKRRYDALRQQIFEHYGRECACCGEREPDFLTLDHINGGGTKHRKSVGQRVYADLRKRGFPTGFRTLCWN